VVIFVLIESWSDNYVYIPSNSSMSPIDLTNSKTPNGKGSQVDALATVHKQTEIANGQDFEKVYSKYLADRTDAANISGNIEELEFLESIKGVESKASEEARLMFMINPPKELAGTMLTFGDSNNKQGVVVGSQMKTIIIGTSFLKIMLILIMVLVKL
jgi:hypothetical protein